MANVCPIKKPPGGLLICETGQLAKVKMVSGEVHASCHRKPPNLAHPSMKESENFELALQNWILGIVKDEKRYLRQPLTEEDGQILNERFYRYFDRALSAEVQVFFTPPNNGIEEPEPRKR